MQIVRIAAVIITITSSVSCQQWKRVDLAENPDAAKHPRMIMVQTKSGVRYQVYKPVFTRDSLRGWADTNDTVPVNIAVSDVTSTQIRQVSAGRTALLGAGFAAFLLFLVVASASLGPG